MAKRVYACTGCGRELERRGDDPCYGACRCGGLLLEAPARPAVAASAAGINQDREREGNRAAIAAVRARMAGCKRGRKAALRLLLAHLKQCEKAY